MDVLIAILNSKLFLFYACIFLLVLLIKWFSFQSVIINGIWFTENGKLPDSVLKNYSEWFSLLRNSPNKHIFKIYFWTDLNTLDSKAKKTLQKLGVKVKDYRAYPPQDDEDQQSLDWVSAFLAKADKNNPFLYAMASDVLRMYLLLKVFPRQHPKAICGYLDCNDISLNQLPRLSQLKKLKALALSRTPLDYDFVRGYTPGISGEWEIYDNDLIITANKNNKEFFQKIFKIYIHNLQDTDRLAQGVLSSFSKIYNPESKLDYLTIFYLVMTSTHMVGTLLMDNETQNSFLCEFKDGKLQKHPIDPLANVDHFLDYRNDKAKTWLVCANKEDVQDDFYFHWQRIFCDRARQLKTDLF